MPFILGGLHILLAIFCAVHVVRSGQQLYWLIILFSFPMLGSLVYLFAIYLPNSRLERHAFKAVSVAAKVLDPTKEVRQARADFEHTPTAQNQMRLAAALVDIGESEEAARLYESALKGPFAQDPDLRFGAARAFADCGRFGDALRHVEALHESRPEYRPEAMLLLHARCLAGVGQAAQARQAFQEAVARFGTFEANAEYAIWALTTGDTATAERLQQEIDKMTKRWNAGNRELNAPVIRRLKAARELATRRQ